MAKKQNVFLNMVEILKREKQLEWACRILITVDVLVILSGYLSYLQIKRQLTSPLIPHTTITQIWYDSNDAIVKASIISAIIFLSGLWLYSFKKKNLALFLFISVPVCYKLLLL